MRKNIVFKMHGDIGKETVGGLFQRNISGRNAVFLAVP